MIDKSVMIITGTRKGIGKYLAEYFAEKGFFVIGCSRSDIDFKLNNYQHFCWQYICRVPYRQSKF